MHGHIPVLYQEVLGYLKPRAGGLYIDGTLGAGGHAAGILAAAAPTGRLLGFDRDPEAIAFAENALAEYTDRFIPIQASFGEMGRYAPSHGFIQVDGVLLDLGLSSRQLADQARGFSFQTDGPLDMRFDPSVGSSAADLVNEMSVEELTKVLSQYGEVRQSLRLAKAIVASRPLFMTGDLVKVVNEEMKRTRSRHPATQVFQALRIAVNDEMGQLQAGLQSAILLLKEGGRIVVISFHSLEDRMVKNTFRELSRDCVCSPEQPVCTCDHQRQLMVLTKKVVRPSEEEVNRNPRSRSARLRVAEKVIGT